MKHITSKYWLQMALLGVLLIIVTGGPNALAETTADVFKGHSGVTSENMEQASYIAKPFVDVLGNITGFILLLLVAWQAVQTALDLVYLYIPILRSLLMPSQNPQQGMMGVIGGITTVSDDMLKAVELNSSNVSQGQVGAGPMPQPQSFGMSGQMGGPMGGMQPGGMGMGGPMGGTNPAMGNTPQNKKSTIVSYLKNRSVSLIFLAIAIPVLVTSSVLMDTGLNLGAWLIKLLGILNGRIEEQLTIIQWFIS